MLTIKPTNKEIKGFKHCKKCYAYYKGKHECPLFLRLLVKKNNA